MTFEPRHENKSCSACPEDQLKPFKFLKISNFSNFQIFLIFKIFPGSQLLSDFQTFFNCWILAMIESSKVKKLPILRDLEKYRFTNLQSPNTHSNWIQLNFILFIHAKYTCKTFGVNVDIWRLFIEKKYENYEIIFYFTTVGLVSDQINDIASTF